MMVIPTVGPAMMRCLEPLAGNDFVRFNAEVRAMIEHSGLFVTVQRRVDLYPLASIRLMVCG